MIKLHAIKLSQIAFLSLLLITLPSFCADDAAEQEARRNITFSCNIPGLNVPLQFERSEKSISKIALTLAAIDHGRLLFKQVNAQQSLQEMVIDHALLAAFRITIGLTSTACHEFGHAICAHYDPYDTLKSIMFRWVPGNILLGSFDGGYTTTKPKASVDQKDDDQPIEIRCKNWIALLKQDKDMHRNRMIGAAAGPLMGALSTYIIYKGARYAYPSLSYSLIVFSEIENDLGNMLPISHMVNSFCDGAAARARSDELKREVEELRAQASELCDGDRFYEAWKKRKKTLENIDKWSIAYAMLNENAS